MDREDDPSLSIVSRDVKVDVDPPLTFDPADLSGRRCPPSSGMGGKEGVKWSYLVLDPFRGVAITPNSGRTFLVLSHSPWRHIRSHQHYSHPTM